MKNIKSRILFALIHNNSNNSFISHYFQKIGMKIVVIDDKKKRVNGEVSKRRYLKLSSNKNKYIMYDADVIT